MAGLFDSLTALLNPANPGGVQPTAAPADPGVIAAPAEADPAAAPDTGTILARLRQQALTQGMAPPPPMKGGGPLGLATGPLPDVKGKNKFNAFVSGVSSGMNAQQTRGDAANAAARDQQKSIFDQWKTVAGIQNEGDKFNEDKRWHDLWAKTQTDAAKIKAAKDAEEKALTPMQKMNMAKEAGQIAGYTPWLPNWGALLSKEEKDALRQKAAKAYKAAGAGDWPFDEDNNIIPGTLVPPGTTPAPAAAAGAAPAPAAVPGTVPTPPTGRPNVTPQATPAAPAPAPAPAPSSLIPVQGPNGERALWDPGRKTFVPVPGNPAPGGAQVAPGGAMGGIDPSAAF